MRFKDFDLNHLVALDQLLSERSVSRAAERLLRTQSTVSGILGRLREQLGDELLVQVGRDMIPTERGQELAPRIRDLLQRIEATILTRPEFDPVVSERSIRIFASDYLMIAGLADAIRAIQRKAPNLRFEVLQPTQFQRSGDAPAELLEGGGIDLLAIPLAFVSGKHPKVPLFTDTFCGLVCRGNRTVGDSATLEQFLGMRHVTVGFGSGALPSYEEWCIRKFGEQARRIDIVAASFATMPFLLAGTQRIALAHRRLAEAFTRILPLRIVEVPLGIPPLTEALQWHHYATTDRALMWVRDCLVAEMSDPAQDHAPA